MYTSYDILGDASEYTKWLALQAPQTSSGEAGQHAVPEGVHDIADLPPAISHVVMHMEPQNAAVVLSAYKELQCRR